MSNAPKVSSTPMTYAGAGVDIDAGNRLVDRIKGAAKSTHRKEVMGQIGGFGALCKIPTGYKNPILVSGTDGVGTKLRIALESGKHDTIGIDLVAMCANDILALGAEPLFFLDYYATGKLNVDIAATVIEGIAQGCKQAGCALVGGETAEMPGMYEGEDYDLAGFCVGIVEEDEIMVGQDRIQAGDGIIGLPSSGPHSNGYSLIRKIVEASGSKLDQPFAGDPDKSLADALIAPTRMYCKSALSLIKQTQVNGIAHITGGGLTENLPRILPDNLACEINLDSWQLPAVFQWLKEHGNVEEQEMLKVFNCGIGLAIVVPSSGQAQALAHLTELGETPILIGKITEQHNSQPVTYLGKL